MIFKKNRHCLLLAKHFIPFFALNTTANCSVTTCCGSSSKVNLNIKQKHLHISRTSLT